MMPLQYGAPTNVRRGSLQQAPQAKALASRGTLRPPSFAGPGAGGDEVAEFLRAHGLQMYTSSLLKQGFDDLETLQCIEDADLRTICSQESDVRYFRRCLNELEGLPAREDGRLAVAEFLEEHGLGKYADALFEAGFDEMDTLLLIDIDDMKDVGMPRGHALKLARKLREHELAACGDVEEPEMPAAAARSAARPAATTRAPVQRQLMAPTPAKPARAAPARALPASGAAAPAWAPACGPELEEASPHMTTAQLSAVEQSWEQVQAVGTCAVGELLYRYTFELAPEAMKLFPPEVRYKYRDWAAEDGVEEEHELLSSPALRRLFAKVLNAVGCTVAGLHDMSKLVPMLLKLGGRHAGYGISDEHFPILGQALHLTLQDVLGDGYTGEVQLGWATVYSFVSCLMIQGLRKSRGSTLSIEDAVKRERSNDQAVSTASGSSLARVWDDRSELTLAGVSA